MEGDRFAEAQPGDPVILLFEQRDDGWHITWDVVLQTAVAFSVRGHCDRLMEGQSSRLLSPKEAGELLEQIRGTLPAFALPAPESIAGPRQAAPTAQHVAQARPHLSEGRVAIREDITDEAIPPHNGHLIHALRSIGYRLEQAVADLIDNSIQAEARNVLIRLVVAGDELVRVLVVDDGKGMGPERLKEALRFGSDTEHPGSSLSKFGMGLKLASLSQCRSLTVVSNDGANVSGRRWTVEGLESGWLSHGLRREELESWLGHPLSRVPGWRTRGTLVAWDVIDRLAPTSGDPARVMRDLRKQLSIHLGLHFHRFLEAGQTGQMSLLETAAAPLNIIVETQERDEPETALHERVSPRNPFSYPRSGHTDYPCQFTVELAGIAPIALRAHIWPARVQLPDYHLDGSQKRQGFYVYRNHRLIQAGGWLRVRQTMDPHLSLARVELDLPAELDHLFHLDIRKVNITEPPGFAAAVLASETCRADGQTWRFDDYLRTAERTYRRREADVVSGLPVVPGEGLPKALRTAFQREHGADLDRFYEITFEWADLDEELYFEFHRSENILYLNRRWRDATLGRRNKSSTDAALMKSMLFLLLEPMFSMGKESRKWREKVARLNQVLVRAARYQDRT